MDDSIKKVLEMLSEGKINAEEAERLITALKGSSKKDYARGMTNNISRGVAAILESVPHFVEPFTDPFHGGIRESIDMEGKEGIALKLVGGSLRIGTSETGKLEADSDVGMIKLDQEGKFVSFKVMGSALRLESPQINKFEAKIMGGHLDGTCPAEEVNISCKGGDIDLAVPVCKSVKFQGFGGNLSLKLPEDGDYDITVKKWMGNFSTDLPVEVQEESDNIYKARLNKGGNLIEIECKTSNVYLGAIKPEEEEEEEEE